jgi:hypothetical protein
MLMLTLSLQSPRVQNYSTKTQEVAVAMMEIQERYPCTKHGFCWIQPDREHFELVQGGNDSRWIEFAKQVVSPSAPSRPHSLMILQVGLETTVAQGPLHTQAMDGGPSQCVKPCG